MYQENNYENNISINKVRSKYILAQIFNNLYQIKKLEIIRYNKNIKNKLNIRINDYIKAYIRIEIEIIPKENENGEFIHLPKIKGEANYHIYFNDNKEEIKRKELNENNKVNKIKIILNYKIKIFMWIIFRLQMHKKIKFIKFNRKDIKNMSHIFMDVLQ